MTDYTFKPRAHRISTQGNLATWQVEVTHQEFYLVKTHAMSGEKTAINSALYLAMQARAKKEVARD